MAEKLAEDLLGPAAEEIGKSIVATIKHQLNYLCCFSENIESMREEAKNLEDERSELQEKVNAASDSLMVIVPKVNTWLNETRNIEVKMKDEIEVKIGNAQSGCLNIKSRYLLSKEAKKITEAMEKHRKKVSEFHNIADPAPPPAVLPFLSRRAVELQSRKQMEDGIVKVLSQAEVVNIVGIAGMGGVGKTTMADKILKRVMDENLVDEAVKVVVSQTLDLLKIQREIAESLGLKDLENVGSLGARARWLFSRLTSTKKILIVLDDIWEKFELEDLGIPCEGGCITLLTSRDKDLLYQMGARVFAMETLSTEEAWSLFKAKAGTCVDDQHLVFIAEEVVKECKGLPVAIITIGSALKDKPKQIWEGALRQLKISRPTNITHVIKDVYMPLRQSYVLLDNRDAQLLFLLCCLFPEDYDISLEYLALYRIGLKMFKGVNSLQEAGDQVCAEIENLKSRSLLLDGYNEDKIKMHDVVRDVAIFIASEKGLIDDKLKSKGQINKNCKWISIYATSSNEPLDYLIGSNFPDLGLLIINMQKYEPYLKISDSMFKGMQNLTVISMENVEFESPPETMEWPNNLSTLQLRNCKFKVLSFVGDLLNLKILDCSDCQEIQELPVEIGRLKFLKLLNLSGCLNLERIAAGIISRRVELEELKILRSFDRWESSQGKMKNVSLKELESLRKLTCLEITIPNITLVNEEINLSQNIVKYKICIGQRSFHVSKHEKGLYLSGLPNEVINYGSWIWKLIATTTIEVLELSGDGSRKWGNLSQTHNTLTGLRIEDCGELKELLDTSTMPTVSGVFPMLRELYLGKLPFLAHLLKSAPNQQVSFNKLREIKIWKCSRLRNLLSLERAKDVFTQLETLEIQE